MRQRIGTTPPGGAAGRFGSTLVPKHNLEMWVWLGEENRNMNAMLLETIQYL